VSNEGKNKNVNQGQAKYDLDLYAPTEKKTEVEPKTVELTVIKRAREQATKQQKDVQETLNERLRTSGAFAAVVKVNSVQGSLAKALGFQSNINQVFKSVGVAFQATQPAIKLAQQMAEAHKSIARTMEPMLETMRQLGEKIQKMFEALRQSLPSFSSIFKKIGSGITSRIAPLVQTVLSRFSNFKHPPWFAKITSVFKNIAEKITNVLRTSFRWLSPIIEVLRRWSEIYFLRLYALVVAAASGDEDATIILMRKWGRYRRSYLIIQRLGDIECDEETTTRNFKAHIQESCFEYLYIHKGANHTPLFGYYRAKLYMIVKLRDEHRKLSRQKRRSLSQDYLPLYEYQGKKYLFTEVAAEVAGKSPQTIRNWIRKDLLPAEKHHYFSQIARKYIDAYIIPFSPQTMQILRYGPIRLEIEEKYITATQLRIQLGISDMYLYRLEKQGLVVPQRNKNKRYYTHQDRTTILSMLIQSTSPRLREKVPTFKAQLASYAT
jgi:hypothetical protein